MFAVLLACAVDNRLEPSGQDVGLTDSAETALEDGLLAVEVPATERHDCLGELARAGDVNGDGNNDLFVSVPHSDEGGLDAGKIMALSGPFEEGQSALDSPIFTVIGHTDLLGEQLIDQRDLDGDGVVDILFVDGGDAYALPGPVIGGIDVSDLQPVVEQDGDRTVYGVALGSLLDRDTIDIAAVFSATNEVGIFGNVASSGVRTAAVPDFVIHGDRTVLARQPAISDVTGDGHGDLLVAGDVVWVIPGPLTGTESDVHSAGFALFDGWTDVVVAAGDVNGDGSEDVLTVAGAARNHEGYARTFDVSAGSSIGTWTGSDPDDRIGAVGTALGDFDGDGKGDVAVGGPENDADELRGRAWILFDAGVSGENEIGDASVVLDGSNRYDNFGHSMVGPGDVMGDEHPDLAVTAWGYDSGSGRLYIFSLLP